MLLGKLWCFHTVKFYKDIKTYFRIIFKGKIILLISKEKKGGKKALEHNHSVPSYRKKMKEFT